MSVQIFTFNLISPANFELASENHWLYDFINSSFESSVFSYFIGQWNSLLTLCCTLFVCDVVDVPRYGTIPFIRSQYFEKLFFPIKLLSFANIPFEQLRLHIHCFTDASCFTQINVCTISESTWSECAVFCSYVSKSI